MEIATAATNHLSTVKWVLVHNRQLINYLNIVWARCVGE